MIQHPVALYCRCVPLYKRRVFMNQQIGKVAVIIPKYGLVGGAEQFAFELTERIARDGRWEMHVFAHRWRAETDRIIFHRIPVISFPKLFTTISFASFVRRKLSGMRFDIVHSHERVFEAHIFTMHGIPHRAWVRDVRKKRMSLYDFGTAWVEHSLITRGNCRKFLAVSELSRQEFLREYEVSPKNIEVMHPGVDVERFQRYERDQCRRYLIERHYLGSETRIILFVSMNFEIKGLDTILAALGRFKAIRPTADFILLVVGRGNIGKYRAMAKEFGIEGQVSFTGVVAKEDIARYYRGADVYAMLSKFDTFGMAALEAMASSVPVVVSDRVGAADLVTQGTNGFVVGHSADAAMIAETIQDIFDEPRRCSMAEAALKTARLHSWDAAADKMRLLYEKTRDRVREMERPVM